MHAAGPRRFQQAVFTVAALAFVAHLVDTVISGTQPLTAELDAAVASGGVALAVAVNYSRIPPTAAASFAVLLGGPWLYGCLHYHVIPTFERGLSPTDLSGIVAGVASLALLAIGVPPLLQVVRRRPPPASEVAGHPLT